MNYTHHELERISYTIGNGQAALYAELAEAEDKTEAADDACTHIQEAKGSFPGEDCLQEAISYCQNIDGRVTKANIETLTKLLEELQSRLARDAEYGLHELQKAERLLNA